MFWRMLYNMSRNISSKNIRQILVESLTTTKTKAYTKSLYETLDGVSVDIFPMIDDADKYEVYLNNNYTLNLTFEKHPQYHYVWNLKTYVDMEKVFELNFTTLSVGEFYSFLQRLSSESNVIAICNEYADKLLTSRLGDDDFVFEETIENLKQKYDVKHTKIGNISKYDIDLGNVVVSITDNDKSVWSVSVYMKERDFGYYNLNYSNLNKVKKFLEKVSADYDMFDAYLDNMERFTNV